MQLELSTLNVLLAMVVALQVWIVREMFTLKTKLAIVLSHCPRCRAEYNGSK